MAGRIVPIRNIFETFCQLKFHGGYTGRDW